MSFIRILIAQQKMLYLALLALLKGLVLVWCSPHKKYRFPFTYVYSLFKANRGGGHNSFQYTL